MTEAEKLRELLVDLLDAIDIYDEPEDYIRLKNIANSTRDQMGMCGC
jgi:hypothetical protein